MPLAGQVGVVTGAGRGIGAAIARRLAAMGSAVVINDLDLASAEVVAKEIVTTGGTAIADGEDVASPDGAARTIAAAVEGLGGLQVLVNNAGLTRGAMAHKMTDAEWDLVHDVCLRGAFNLCRAAYGALRGDRDQPLKRNRKVVNISSINGIYGSAASVNYSAAKAGLIGLTKGLAREWARLGINVNAVAPGYIAGTGLTARRTPGSATGMDDEVRERIERSIPLGRGGTPEDIAGVVAFLVSPDSDYVTGQVIEAHGGLEIIPVFG